MYIVYCLLCLTADSRLQYVLNGEKGTRKRLKNGINDTGLDKMSKYPLVIIHQLIIILLSAGQERVGGKLFSTT
jgi:hypothetical protein